MSAGRASGRAWGRFALLVAAVASIVAIASAAASATANARRPRAASPDIRRWHGTWIESMDASPTASVRAAPAAATGSPGAAHTDQQLSNERTFTRWAYVERIATIYRRPTSSSPKVTRLHWYTEDGFDEVYLVLRTHWDKRGQEWVELRIPARPNGQVGWVRRGTLGRFHLTHTLVVVNRKRLRMYFYDNGRKIWSAPVGIGKPSTPTPGGHYWIRERFMVIPKSSGYYPYAFGTSDYSTLADWEGGGVVGIHGPYGDAPRIPGQISHGCIRLQVSDDFWLGAHIQLGTPVHVI